MGTGAEDITAVRHQVVGNDSGSFDEKRIEIDHVEHEENPVDAMFANAAAATSEWLLIAVTDCSLPSQHR